MDLTKQLHVQCFVCRIYNEDFTKPLVGVASTGAKVTPCNMHLNKLSVVEDSINASGGKGVLFNTITVSCISMGTQGMKYSLVSREVIADQLKLWLAVLDMMD